MKRIGLALGGGGARGGAHLGVLLELERLGIRPNLVAGTSIGGIIGALLASGLSLQAIHRFLIGFTFGEVYVRPESMTSLVSNKGLRNKLHNAIGRPNFSDLHLPLGVVATDLKTHRERVLTEGDVVSAVLATSAIPPALPPVERDGHILIDGGVLNNVPVDVAFALGADVVIAVDIMKHAQRYGQPLDISSAEGKGIFYRSLTRFAQQPIWQVIFSTVDIAVDRAVQAKLAATPPDILLQPDIGTINLFDFHRLEEGIEAGRAAVRRQRDEIMARVALA